MKKLLNIGFLITVAFCSLNVHADGGMTTGNRTCTQNCGGLYGGEVEPSNTDADSKDESISAEVYAWVVKMIIKITD